MDIRLRLDSGPAATQPAAADGTGGRPRKTESPASAGRLVAAIIGLNITIPNETVVLLGVAGDQSGSPRDLGASKMKNSSGPAIFQMIARLDEVLMHP
jgi:hypothetical protein